MINWSEVLNAPIFIIMLTGISWLFYKYRNVLLLWLKRCRLKFFPVKFNVGLSIDTNEGINVGKYFNEIKKNLEKIIQSLQLNQIIIIKDFSDIYAFKNKDEAENYRRRKNLDLIIWGDFSPDGLKLKNEIINKITLNFTYSYPKNINDKENRLGKAIILDISSRLALKNYWQIVESNSLEDIEIVSNNLADISLYIIGLTLKFYGRLNESKEIFEKLYCELTLRDDNFRNLVLPHLFHCYEIFIKNYSDKKNYNKGIEYCEKILKIDNKNYFALTNFAPLAYKSGDEKICEQVVENLLEFYPKDPCTEVDVAFVRIIQKKFKNAYKHYVRLVNLREVNFNFQETIEFLSNEYNKIKEPAMLYGSGILSYYWGDKLLAKQDFNSFLILANERDYKDMYRNASRLIKLI